MNNAIFSINYVTHCGVKVLTFVALTLLITYLNLLQMAKEEKKPAKKISSIIDDLSVNTENGAAQLPGVSVT